MNQGVADDARSTHHSGLPLLASVYIALVIASGAAIVVFETIHFGTFTHFFQFLTYMLCAALASGLKVRLPGIDGTMSVNFLFVLLAITDLSSGEALWIGIISVLIQYLWYHPGTPKVLQVAFNIAGIAITIASAALVFHSQFWHNAGLGIAVRIALTTSVYFCVNTATIAVVVALTEKKPIGRTWRNSYLWSFLYYLVGAAIVTAMHFLSMAVGWQSSLMIVPVVCAIYRSFRLYLDRIEAERQHAEDVAGLYLRTIEALALAIEAKDHGTGEHLHRVTIYAKAIGREMRISEAEMKALEVASLLHDIGKIAVSEQIISKPGRLTPAEFDKMKTHPIVGAEILEPVRFPYPVVPIVEAHHEKWDGTGYPYGLAGESIPIGARILSVVDCLDALASDRPYRQALSLEEAIGLVKAQAGSAFDPAVVEVLARVADSVEEEVRTAKTSVMRLSTDIKVASAAVPGAGFADEPAVKALVA